MAININSWDLPDGDETKNIIQEMGRREEQDLINDAKTVMTSGRVTATQVRDRLTEFMEMWDPGTRVFYLIPSFIESLGVPKTT